MSFFKKLNEQNNNEPILPTDPNKLFYSLNKKEEGIEYLRDGQNEVLENYISRKVSINKDEYRSWKNSCRASYTLF